MSSAIEAPPLERPPGGSIPAAYYKVKGRGFFSEFNILAHAYAHCLAHGRTIFVDVNPSAGPWRELFSPFPKPGRLLHSDPRIRVEASLEPKLPDQTWNPDWIAMRLEVRDACLEKRRVKLPLLGFEGPFDELVFLAARKLFRPEPSLVHWAATAKQEMGLDKIPYAAVQLRRGDKVHGYRNPRGDWVVETDAAPFSLYDECLSRIAPELKDVFVISDDYSAFEEARTQFPQYRFHTLCEPHERGYIHAEQQAAPAEAKLAKLRKLLVTVMIGRESQAFVGTYFSNLSIGLYMLHRHHDRCVSIEPARARPEMEPVFPRGRDEI